MWKTVRADLVNWNSADKFEEVWVWLSTPIIKNYHFWHFFIGFPVQGVKPTSWKWIDNSKWKRIKIDLLMSQVRHVVSKAKEPQKTKQSHQSATFAIINLTCSGKRIAAPISWRQTLFTRTELPCHFRSWWMKIIQWVGKKLVLILEQNH